MGVAGCLWDVTDRDLDRFTRAVVKAWLLPDYQAPAATTTAAESDAGAAAEFSLPLCAALVRGVCKLQFLVGTAPVCYGLPVVAAP